MPRRHPIWQAVTQYDIEVPDRPGELTKLTRLLAKESIRLDGLVAHLVTTLPRGGAERCGADRRLAAEKVDARRDNPTGESSPACVDRHDTLPGVEKNRQAIGGKNPDRQSAFHGG